MPTVTRAGGNIAGSALLRRVSRAATSACGVGVSTRSALLSAAGAAADAPLRNPVVGDERDERQRLSNLCGQRFRLPTLTTGGLFARTSGLLVPAPSAPVSDAFTTSSTL